MKMTFRRVFSPLESRLLKTEQVSTGPVVSCRTALRERWPGLPPAFMPSWDLTALQPLVRAESWLQVEGCVFVPHKCLWVATEGLGRRMGFRPPVVTPAVYDKKELYETT